MPTKRLASLWSGSKASIALKGADSWHVQIIQIQILFLRNILVCLLSQIFIHRKAIGVAPLSFSLVWLFASQYLDCTLTRNEVWDIHRVDVNNSMV